MTKNTLIKQTWTTFSWLGEWTLVKPSHYRVKFACMCGETLVAGFTSPLKTRDLYYKALADKEGSIAEEWPPLE